MTRATWIGVVVIGLVSGPATIAAAQEDRFIISVNGGFQPTKNDFAQTLPFTINVEVATSTTSYKVPGAPLADVGFIVRLGSRFGAGVAGGASVMKGDGTITARIPHPLYFDKHRDVSGTGRDLDRRETSLHAQGAFLWPAGDRFLIIFSGGPSLFIVNQKFATTVHYAEEYPFDTATFTSVDLKKTTERRFGFNAGVDLTYRFAGHFGIGGVVRFSRAKVKFDKGQESIVSVNAGGVQTGAGLRILF